MQVYTVLLLTAAVAVYARPSSPDHQDSQQFEDLSSASLPCRRSRLQLEDGGEVPVHLIYEGQAVFRRRRGRRSILGGQAQQQPPKEYGGPSIVKLKVRRGGVAIAGPGGVATAGSGGTAIVGPGGTAYTTPDGTAVVGPGGRLVQLEPYVTKGRAAAPRFVANGPLIYYPIQMDFNPDNMMHNFHWTSDTDLMHQ